MNVGSMQCCGFREISGLSEKGDSVHHLKEFCKHFNRVPGSYLPRERATPPTLKDFSVSHAVFTATGRAKYGRAFAALITQEGLGELVCSTLADNPNSGHKVQGWIWTINKQALVEWYKEHR